MDNSFVLSVYKFQIERGGGESLLKSKNAKKHSFQKNQGGGGYILNLDVLKIMRSRNFGRTGGKGPFGEFQIGLGFP